MYSTLDSSAHSMSSYSLRHYKCTTPMANIRPDWDPNPVLRYLNTIVFFILFRLWISISILKYYVVRTDCKIQSDHRKWIFHQGGMWYRECMSECLEHCIYAQPRWHISALAGIRTQYLRVSSQNRTEWTIGAIMCEQKPGIIYQGSAITRGWG